MMPKPRIQLAVVELQPVADAVDGEEGDQHIVEQRGRAHREEQHRRLPDEGEEAAAALLLAEGVILDLDEAERQDAEQDAGDADAPGQEAVDARSTAG